MTPQLKQPKFRADSAHPAANCAITSQASLAEYLPFRTQLPTLLLITSIFFINFIARIIFSPLMPTIEEDLTLSHSEAGSLFFLISFGYFLALLGSGWVSSRLTHRNTILLSSAGAGVIMLAVALSKDLWTMRVGLFCLGLAAGIYLPSGISTLTSLINPRQWGKAIAVHELAPNLGFVAAPLISEAALLVLPWRGILLVIGLAALVSGFVFARFGRGGEFPGQPPSLRIFRALLRERSFAIMVILFALGISGFLGIYTMLPLYLVTEQGINRNVANTLVALSRIPGLGLVFVGGWATDRFGPKHTMLGVYLVTGIATVLLGILSGSWLTVVVFLQPMIAVCFPPAAMVALSSIGPAEARNVAVSFTVPFAFLAGGGLIPVLIGVMADAGSFALGITIVGAVIVCGSFLPRYLSFPSDSARK